MREVSSRTGGRARNTPAAELRARLDGDLALPLAVGATIEAWRAGAPFGLALGGDAERAETLFRRLRPHADWVARASDADEPPPRAARGLALCAKSATLPSAVGRRCTAVVDVDAVIAPGRRPAGETEGQLWRRVVAALAAHGVNDGAIDVAACALASALVDAGYDGDPVALVRVWVAVPHGRRLATARAGEAGGTEPADAVEQPPGAESEGPAGPEGADTDADAETETEKVSEEGNGEQAPAEGGAEDGAEDGVEQPSDSIDTGEGVDGVGDAQAPSGENATDPRRIRDESGPDSDADAVPSAESPHPGDERQRASRTDDAGPAGTPDAGIAIDAAADALPSARAAAFASVDLGDQAVRATVRSGRSARRGATRSAAGRGRPGRIVAPERAGGRIAILPTLQRAAQRYAAHGAEGDLAVTRDDLRGRLRAQPTATHAVVVVDGSSSMGSAGAAHARSVADVALGHVYRDRGDVSVILAAGSFARVVQERTPRVSRARAALQRASVEGGGGTPLADAVRLAVEQFADAPRERCRLVIVSDGQATVDLAGSADPRTATRDLRVQLDRAATRAGRTVFVPLDPRGWAPLERTLAPFRAAGVEVADG
ncbi:VWA domain-containing protein [Microbacterium sp. BWR-S6Y]|uniref:VWA domain-containing protein n=1 Tax=Microbacterium sp. BWR-S6Y TaxID=3232073 RepID=UPI0035295E67